MTTVRIPSIYNQQVPNILNADRNSFRAPDKGSYPEKPLKNVYQFRNQPIHRSTYGRDFLVFGSVPSYPFK